MSSGSITSPRKSLCPNVSWFHMVSQMVRVNISSNPILNYTHSKTASISNERKDYTRLHAFRSKLKASFLTYIPAKYRSDKPIYFLSLSDYQSRRDLANTDNTRTALILLFSNCNFGLLTQYLLSKRQSVSFRNIYFAHCNRAL